MVGQMTGINQSIDEMHVRNFHERNSPVGVSENQWIVI